MRTDIIITQKLIAAYQDIQKRNPPTSKGNGRKQVQNSQPLFAYMAKANKQ